LKFASPHAWTARSDARITSGSRRRRRANFPPPDLASVCLRRTEPRAGSRFLEGDHSTMPVPRQSRAKECRSRSWAGRQDFPATPKGPAPEDADPSDHWLRSWGVLEDPEPVVAVAGRDVLLAVLLEDLDAPEVVAIRVDVMTLLHDLVVLDLGDPEAT